MENAPVKVYVVRQGEYMEGSTVVGVYASLEGALEAIEQFMSEHPPSGEPWSFVEDHTWVCNAAVDRIWWELHELQP